MSERFEKTLPQKTDKAHEHRKRYLTVSETPAKARVRCRGTPSGMSKMEKRGITPSAGRGGPATGI